MAGLFQVFDGLQVVGTAVLRGVGDTRVPMVLHIAGFWLVGLPVSLWVGFGLGAGAVGLWWGLAVGLGVVALLLLARVVKRFSGELRRLIIEDPARLPSPPAPEPAPARVRRRAAGEGSHP